MRHRVRKGKLGLKTEHRLSMLRNLCTELFRHGRITSTDVRIKELKRFSEKIITTAKVDTIHSRRLVNTKIKDTNCALKMFDRKILKKIKLFSNDYSLPTELSLKAEMLGLDIVDLPIKHKSRQDGKSKINIIFTSLKFLKFLIKLKSKFIIYEKK